MLVSTTGGNPVANAKGAPGMIDTIAIVTTSSGGWSVRPLKLTADQTDGGSSDLVADVAGLPAS